MLETDVLVIAKGGNQLSIIQIGQRRAGKTMFVELRELHRNISVNVLKHHVPEGLKHKRHRTHSMRLDSRVEAAIGEWQNQKLSFEWQRIVDEDALTIKKSATLRLHQSLPHTGASSRLDAVESRALSGL